MPLLQNEEMASSDRNYNYALQLAYERHDTLPFGGKIIGICHMKKSMSA